MRRLPGLALVLGLGIGGVSACDDDPPEEEAVEEIEESLEELQDSIGDIIEEAEEAEQREDITPPR